MGYGKVNFTNKGFQAGFFTNILNGDAANLLSVDPAGKPIGFDFLTKTFDFEASNVQTFKEKHVVTYGGNLRFNTFDLSIAPQADNRTEGGGYIQDEIFLLDDVPPGRRRPRRSLRLPRRLRVLAARDLHGQAGGQPHAPRVVQPRVSLAVGDQQLPRHHDRRAAALGRVLPGCWPAGST